MQRITDEELNQLKQEISLADLVRSSGVELKAHGENLIGLCPFHDDKNPSLVITPKKKLWNCLGACSEGGSVIDWVMKSQNLDFKQAVNHLKPGSKKPTEQAQVITLDLITEHYHKKLYDNKPALNYLKQRGFNKPELYGRFKIGFADGTLSKMIDPDQKEALKQPGIYRANGREHLYGCITIPLFSDQNRVVGMYGRNINEKNPFKHLYLKGEHTGIFNRKASKAYDQIILTESILDALSLIELGLENVHALYGINGLTAAHIETLKQDRVKTIILALDNDKAGHKATETIRETLEAENFNVTATFPEKKDWNEVLTQADKPFAEIKEQLSSMFTAPDPFNDSAEPPQTACFESVTKDPLGTIFKTRDLIYKVTGIKELFVSNLRVGIKATQAGTNGERGETYYDSLDLYAAKSRTYYSRNLSRIFGLEPKRVEKDLIRILEHLENERDQQLLSNQTRKPRQRLTPEEVKLGMDFLKSPKLFKVIAEDLETMGYTGEDLNKQLLYLAASSRLMDDPISVIIQSQSASGKSKMVDTIIELMPPESVVSITSLSDQALNYSGDLMHKFLSLGEAVHSEVVEHQIREMLSAKRLSRLVTLKDPKTGKMVSKAMETPAVVSAVITATGYRINPENASRSFLLNIDESREQTRKIHQKQRSKYSPARFYEKRDKIPFIISKHQAAQRLLKKRIIFNRFAELIDFPDGLVRTRRDNERFIDLIAVVCFLRQYQKPVKNDGKTDYIECDLNDYKVAYEIMVKGVLHSSLEEIPQGSRTLYEALRELAGTKAKMKKLGVHEISFTQREIRESTGFSQSWVNRHLRVLIDYEYIIRTSGGFHRTKGFYKLIKGDCMERLDLSMIPKPETMKQRFKNQVSPESFNDRGQIQTKSSKSKTGLKSIP